MMNFNYLHVVIITTNQPTAVAAMIALPAGERDVPSNDCLRQGQDDPAAIGSPPGGDELRPMSSEKYASAAK